MTESNQNTKTGDAKASDLKALLAGRIRKQADKVKGLRGKAWYREYQKLIELAKPELVRLKKEVEAENGKFTLRDLIILAEYFDMYLKNTTEILEDAGEIESGTFERIKTANETQAEWRERIYKDS